MAIDWQATKKRLKNFGKNAKKMFAKMVCVFDDIPFLLQIKDTGNVGTYLLAGAGFLIFPVEGYEGITALMKAYNMKSSPKRKALVVTGVAKIGFALLGLAASAALIAFIATNLAVLTAAASIAIPAVMAAIVGVELGHHIFNLYDAKQKDKGVSEAKSKVAYSSVFFGFSLAIAGLATLSVLTGLSVLSFGVVPAALLVAVVVAALSVKIFQILDNRKDENGIKHHPLSTGLKKGWDNFLSLFCCKPCVQIEVRANHKQKSGMGVVYDKLGAGTDQTHSDGEKISPATEKPESPRQERTPTNDADIGLSATGKQNRF